MTLLYKYEILYEAKLLQRPSKKVKSPYMADIFINETESLAHCPALGISGLLNKNSIFYVSQTDDSKRKSQYTIELVYLPSTKNNYVLTNTNPQFGNKIFESIIKNKLIEEYDNFIDFKKEKKYKDSRFDFYIKKNNNKEEYIEIKSVLLCNFQENDYPDCVAKPEIDLSDNYEKAAIFPDGYRKNKNVPISARAIKHLETLEDCIKNNYDASLYFIIQRNDCEYFKPSNIDQFYKKALEKAKKNGVNIKAISVDWSTKFECIFDKFIDVIVI